MYQRKRLGLTQAELARKVDISGSYLNDIEHGRRTPSCDSIMERFSRALEVSEDYLHYLNGRFPLSDRKLQPLPMIRFMVAMEAFRREYQS